jgi:hypothetical protein
MSDLIQTLNGKQNRQFFVGEKLPDDAYLPVDGMVATIVNDKIPDGVFILIKEHTIIKIIDARDTSGRVTIDMWHEDADAIGMSEFTFNSRARVMNRDITRH